MTVFCTIMGTACFLYYVFLALRAGIMVNFGWFWIVMGALFLFVAFLRRFPDSAAAVWAQRILLFVLAAVFLVIGFFSAFVISGMSSAVSDDLSYVIVLGTQVRGTRPSLALMQRITKAQEVAQNNPDLTFILSGGQGQGEDISEAQCMWNYLTQSGVSPDRLILEDRSTTTRENLLFSDRLTGCSKKSTALISNDFHICRALKIARSVGYEDVYGIAAKSEPIMKPHYFVREAVALIVLTLPLS